MVCLHGNKRPSRCKKCPDAVGICEHRVRRRRCRECNIGGYLHNIVGNRIRSALRNNKELSSQEYLGCTIQEFKKHIEEQFTEGMRWDNIHIDHIEPIHYGGKPTLEEIKKRLHYKNTQPLFAKDNLSKGARFVG